MLKETSGFSALHCNTYTYVRKNIVPGTCKPGIFPIPHLSPLLPSPSHPTFLVFSTIAVKVVTNLGLRKEEGINQRAEIIKLDRWKRGEISIDKAGFSRVPGGLVLPDASQPFQCCSGRQLKIPATKVCKQHKKWQSGIQRCSRRSHRALQTSWSA